MKTLYLLRHAKAESPAFEDDFKRTLSTKGRHQIELMGTYLRQKQVCPDIVLCSSSERTNETVDLLVPYFEKEPIIERTKKLYLARTGHILAQAWSLDESHSSALIVGHNPGLHELAYALPKNRTSEHALKIQGGFPTAAFVAFDFEGDTWASVDYGEGTITDVIYARDLKE